MTYREDAQRALTRLGIHYGGRGPGGEYYSKDLGDGLSSVSLWTEGEESWTPEELEAIALHKRTAKE